MGKPPSVTAYRVVIQSGLVEKAARSSGEKLQVIYGAHANGRGEVLSSG